MTSKIDKLFIELGISKNALKEMEYFCLQYNEKKLEIIESYDISSIRYEFRPSNHNISNTTLTTTEKIISLKEDIEMIEQSAIEVSGELYKYLLENVVNKTAYEYMQVPCGRRQFYEKRKLFFCILYMKMQKRKKG